MFYSNDVTETCIGWQEMNDLLSNMYQVMYEFIPDDNNFILKVKLDDNNSPDNMIYIRNCYIVGVSIDGINGNSYITHNALVNYGEYKTVSDNVLPQQPLD